MVKWIFFAVTLSFFKQKSEFLNNVLTLVGGSSIAQAIPLLISPILARVYTPDDFGLLALYMSIFSVISVVATGRYELAIMLPKNKVDVVNIVVLSVLIAFFISALLFIIIQVFNDFIVDVFGNPDLSGWLYLIPVSVLLAGFCQTLTYWNNKIINYKVLVASRVSQSGATATAQLTLNHGGIVPGGLIVGSLIGQLIAFFVIGQRSWKSISSLFSSVTRTGLLENLKKYRKFPLFSSWGALVNCTANQMPVFIIAKEFGGNVVGMYSLVYKVLNMPITLIAGAVTQVLFQKIVTINQNSPKKLYMYVVKVSAVLIAIVFPFVVSMFLFGESLFVFVFGVAWSEAGRFAPILSIAIAMRFVVSPLSAVLLLECNVTKGVIWQLIYFCTLASTLLSFSFLDIYTFLLVFVSHEVVLYSIYFAIILRASKFSAISSDLNLSA